MVRWVLALAVLLFSASCHAEQPAPNCQFFKVKVPSLNVSAEPRGDSTYIDVLDGGDMACVTAGQKVGDRDWSYIVYVLKGGDRRSVGGWANQQGLQRASGAEAGVAPGAPAAPPPSNQYAPAPPPPSPPPAPAAASGDDIIQWGVPLASGPYPVAGQTLEQLSQRAPVFSPLDGLDEKYWKKECNNCHQWTRESLCTQGQSYVADPNKILRIKHPYGGAFKLAIWRWAKGGCP